MKTLKENFYDVIKLFVNQFGIGIFALFLYTDVGVAFVEDDAMFNLARILVSVFSTIFYIVLVYYMFWEIGAKDGIRISGGRMEPQPAKGAILALWANIPNLVLSGVALILLVIYSLSGSEGVYSAFSFFFMIETWLLDMYMGIIQGVTAPITVEGSFSFLPTLIQSLLYLVVPSFVSVLTVHFSYRLGLKDRKLFSRAKKENVI